MDNYIQDSSINRKNNQPSIISPFFQHSSLHSNQLFLSSRPLKTQQWYQSLTVQHWGKPLALEWGSPSSSHVPNLELIRSLELRIYFADFSFLHCSIEYWPEALYFTLEPWRSYEDSWAWSILNPSNFQEPSGACRTTCDVHCSSRS